MMRITNIWATDRAYDVLRERRAKCKPRYRGEVFALSYMSSFTDADGTTVEGFRPGFMAGPWPIENIGPGWLVAELADGTTFHFRPRGEWNPRENYLIDAVGPLFSIEAE